MNSDSLFCRLCAELYPEYNLIKITDEKAISIDLAYKIIQNYSVKITEDDVLPKHVCAVCCEKVCNDYEFRELVNRSQEILMKRMINVKQENVDYSSDTKEDIFDLGQFEPETKLENYTDEDNSSEDDLPLSETKASLKDKIEKAASTSEDNFEPPNERKRHTTETKKFKWKCEECSQKFKTKKKLRNHLANIHNSLKFECKECSKEYSSYESYQSHKRIHKSSSVCEICGKNCRDAAHLKQHLQTHSDVKPFVCNECNKGFKTIKALESHKRTHLPNDVKKKFECDVCDKKFTTKAHLNTHKENHTSAEPERNYVCEQCGRNFRQKANLKQHMSTHLDIFPFRCDKCPKAFKNVYSLRRHQKNHSVYELFKCETCLRQFRHKRALKRHSNIHTNKLPYECEHCHKCFREKSYLKIHLRQHTGEKPYSCIECNHYFTNDSNFIKHLKGRHGLDNFSVANQRQYPFVNYGQNLTLMKCIDEKWFTNPLPPPTSATPLSEPSVSQ